MTTIALATNIRHLKEAGFSEKQAESLLQVTQNQAESLLQVTQNQAKELLKDKVDETDKKMVTKAYLDLQVENIKKSLLLQVGGMVFSGFLILGWHINYLDNKTRAYVDARFEAQDTRLDKIEADISSIELEIKELKNLIITLIAENKTNKKSKRKLASLR